MRRTSIRPRLVDSTSPALLALSPPLLALSRGLLALSRGLLALSRGLLALSWVLLACAGPTPPVQGGDLDWLAVSDVEVIEIVTTDPDGDVRETNVWFVLVDATPYLRTNDSRWLENIRRDPEVRIVIEGTSYAQRAREVTSPELIERVDAASREKYGFQDSLIHVFRISDPEILELSDPS